MVGLETDAGVWIGTDSFLGTDEVRVCCDRPKWFRKGPLVFAWAGDARAAQLVQHAMPVPALRGGESADPMRYLVAAASKMQKVLRDAGANLRSPGTADLAGTTFLVVYRGRLYYLQYDYSVIRNRRGYAAIGAGEAYGIAALAALKDRVPPAEAVRGALEVAARLCPQVSAPFHVELFS